MQLIDGQAVYAATDLVGFLACGHLTDLERCALARLTRRPERPDPQLDRIRKRGYQHEQRYKSDLAAGGLQVTDLDEPADPWTADRGARLQLRAQQTVEAIERGDDVIFQACFFDGTWLGFADFLLRVERPTPTLPWSYEVADTKLARSVKASAILQLSSYSEHLARIQGMEPEQMHVVLGGSAREVATFRVARYVAYYRTVKRRFMETVGAPLPVTYPPPLPSYPDPVEHCDVCRWWPVCTDRRRRDDDLSLVAGMPGRTRSELQERAVPTRRSLAVLPLPVSPRLERTSAEALAHVREQARLQVATDEAGHIVYERLPIARTEAGVPDTAKGLLALPAPSSNDLFLDLEGDPFALDDGVDYLFGILEPGRTGPDGEPVFHAFWARDEDGRVTPGAEQRAFEQAMDLIVERLAADPTLHVYHYAAYEPTHLGMLMGRYGTREEEVDRLMRGDILVDLFSVVRQGLRVGVESYSIKKLEPLYGYEREVDLKDAGSSIVAFETWLEVGGEAGEDDETLVRIERYNRDDVVSTWRLRDWLEGQRAELEQELGEALPRPVVKAGEASETLAEWLAEVRATEERLVAGLPDDLAAWDARQQGRWLLAQLLEWHRREEKPGWWRYFHLLEMPDEERLEEREPLAMLELIGPQDETARTYRYRFPPQEHEIGDHGGVDPVSGKTFSVVELDDMRGEVVLRFAKSWKGVGHPTALVPELVVRTTELQKSLLRIGQAIAADELAEDGPFRAARDLLARRAPHVSGHAYGADLRSRDLSAEDAAHALVTRLERSHLAIQGPPGSGKTWTGARLILDLVAAGKKVGVTANSHKVIGKLLDDVAAAARSDKRFAEGRPRIGQKPSEGREPTCGAADPVATNAAARSALDGGDVDIVGGTAWLWASDKLASSVDVLFIDEAGQFSLANAVAVSAAADSLVLLGDPQQLDQPTQGTHPPGAGHSALAHLLAEHATMPGHLGLFMDRTWRLHPDICAYTSEAFYDGQLEPQEDNWKQGLAGVPPLDGTGVRYLAVDHVADRDDNDSPAEAEVVAEMVGRLLSAGATWTDSKGESRPVTPADILIVSPFNLHRRRIRAALEAQGEAAARVPVGTVDKFQGQQAPISIYSMATSRPEDAPRGLEFLYSLNRLNVATSRARCLTLVVASPALVVVDAKTPRQMELANALCRFVAVAGGDLQQPTAAGIVEARRQA